MEHALILARNPFAAKPHKCTGLGRINGNVGQVSPQQNFLPRAKTHFNIYAVAELLLISVSWLSDLDRPIPSNIRKQLSIS